MFSEAQIHRTQDMLLTFGLDKLYDAEGLPQKIQ